MTVPSVPTVPAPAAMRTPWEYTPPGIRERWVREKMRQMLAHIAACQRAPDYDDAVGFMGARKAAKMMHAFYDEQCCSNHAPSAR